MCKTNTLQCLLLAAGNASRMGRVKQLLPCKGKKLLEYTLEQLTSTNIPIVLVLGANAELIIEQIKINRSVVNTDWQAGLGTSIAFGVAQLDHDCEAALIALADQVELTTEHYQQLINRWKENPELIVCAQYDGQPGVPAIFPRHYFSDLVALEGEKGAKAILQQNISTLLMVKIPQAKIDIDTLDDWQAWCNR